MAVLFFDTSALVRRYDPAEPGAQRVRSMCRRPAGHTLVIARLTTVEVASALARQLRQGRTDSRQQTLRWRLFGRHLRYQYRIVPLDDRDYRTAERLLFAHPLRAYDALQLACALRSLQLLAGVAADLRFCTADRVQARAASGEGLAVEFIA